MPRICAAIELRAAQDTSPRAWSFDGSGRVWGYEPGLTIWSSPALGVAGDKPIVVAGNYDQHDGLPECGHGRRALEVHHGRSSLFGAGVFSGRRPSESFSPRPTIELSTPSIPYWGARFGFTRSRIFGRLSAAPVWPLPAWAESARRMTPFLFPTGFGIARSPTACNASGVVALAVDDGHPLWRSDLGEGELTAAIFARVAGRGTLFLGSSSGNVYALSASDGKVLWKKAELDCVRSQPAFLATSQGPLLVTGSKFGTLRGLDALTGAERWQFRTGDRITGAPAILDGDKPRAFVGSYDRKLYALGASDGALAWRDTARGGVFSSVALIAQGREPMVLSMAWDHMLHANALGSGAPIFTAFTGQPIWNVGGMDDSNWSSPVAVDPRTLDGLCRQLRWNLAGSSSRSRRASGAGAAIESVVLAVVPDGPRSLRRPRYFSHPARTKARSEMTIADAGRATRQSRAAARSHTRGRTNGRAPGAFAPWRDESSRDPRESRTWSCRPSIRVA